MRIDNELVLADDSTCSGTGQAFTSDAAGTKYGSAAVIDMKGGGNDHSKMWFFFKVGTTFAGSSPVVNVKLQTSKDNSNWDTVLESGGINAAPTGGKLTTGDVTYSDFTDITSSTLKLKINGEEKTYTVGTMASVDGAAAIASVFNTACGDDVTVSNSSSKIVFTSATVAAVGKPSTIEFVSWKAGDTSKASLLGTITAEAGDPGLSKNVEFRQRLPLINDRYMRVYFDVVSGTVSAGSIFAAIVDEVMTTMKNTVLAN